MHFLLYLNEFNLKDSFENYTITKIFYVPSNEKNVWKEKYIYIYMWEPKMCRLALQLLGMLGNVLSRPRHALQRPKHALQRPRHACNVLGRPQHASTRS